jgi:hypothetical protein
MRDDEPLVPFWVDMTILFAMTVPVMVTYAVTSWKWLMPLGGLNLCLALAIIAFVRHVRRASQSKHIGPANQHRRVNG